MLIRGAVTETLPPSVADLLFQVTGPEPGLVRIMLARDGAIDGFVNSGNRMFPNSSAASQHFQWLRKCVWIAVPP